MSSEAELEGLRALAEAALDPRPPSLIRYNHGGGRLFVEQGNDRDLIADFYDEAPREFYNAASPSAILSLLDSLQSTRAALERAEARMEAADELLEQLQSNPYPVKVFPKLTDADWASLIKWCKSRGFPLDRLSGSYGRDFRNGIFDHVQRARKLLQDEVESAASREDL